MIQQGTHINQIQPVDAVFVPPQKLLVSFQSLANSCTDSFTIKNKLVYYSGLIVLCHETPGYREPATKILLVCFRILLLLDHINNLISASHGAISSLGIQC